jgi:(p)ppGpp synthase/HD superfamily hydrolase
MAHDFKRLTNYLVSLGTGNVPHSNTPFLAHLIAVYRDLQEWGAPEYLVLAGLYHSIYSTDSFRKFGLPLERRDEVRELIGERAERLAYVNCALTRDSLDASVASGRPQLWDRFREAPLEVSDAEFTDLITLHLCDRLEQAARLGDWEYRREAWEQMARRLGGIALERWSAVFSQAPALVPTA